MCIMFVITIIAMPYANFHTYQMQTDKIDNLSIIIAPLIEILAKFQLIHDQRHHVFVISSPYIIGKAHHGR